MKYPLDPDNAAMFGLFYSLLLSLESRRILKQSEFISDLEQIIALAKKDKFLAPSTLSEISRLKSWFEDQNSRIQEK